EVSRPVAPLAVGEGEGEDVPRRAGRGGRPGRAAGGRAVNAALLSRDPRRPGIDAGHREQRSLGARVRSLPGGATVAGVEGAAELAHHPAVPIGREAGAEEPLPHLTERDRRGARPRREEQEPGPDETTRRLHRRGLTGWRSGVKRQT